MEVYLYASIISLWFIKKTFSACWAAAMCDKYLGMGRQSDKCEPGRPTAPRRAAKGEIEHNKRKDKKRIFCRGLRKRAGSLCSHRLGDNSGARETEWVRGEGEPVRSLSQSTSAIQGVSEWKCQCVMWPRHMCRGRKPLSQMTDLQGPMATHLVRWWKTKILSGYKQFTGES